MPHAVEPWVSHLSRLPKSLDADLRRIAAAERSTFADLEREWLRAGVELYDHGGVDARVEPEVLCADDYRFETFSVGGEVFECVTHMPTGLQVHSVRGDRSVLVMREEALRTLAKLVNADR